MLASHSGYPTRTKSQVKKAITKAGWGRKVALKWGKLDYGSKKTTPVPTNRDSGILPEV